MRDGGSPRTRSGDRTSGPAAAAPQEQAASGDPGPAYWMMAGAVALALTAPAPFFWAPPVWVTALMGQSPPVPRTVRTSATRGLRRGS